MTVSRKRTAQFDLAEVTFLPGEDLVRSLVAHQIRQDMWRKLQRLRGFCPAVRVTTQPGGVAVLAGGAVTGPITDRTRSELTDLLSDPDTRARWMRNARKRR